MELFLFGFFAACLVLGGVSILIVEHRARRIAPIEIERPQRRRAA